MSENQSHEKLEIEDEDERLNRLQFTLERLNTTSSTSTTTTRPFPLPVELSKPHAIPQSDLIARVQAFLSALEASNAVLEQQRQADPNSVDIESVAEDAQQYIEMNLGLGLFEERGKTTSGSGEDESDSTSTGSSDEGSEMDDDSDEAEKEEEGVVQSKNHPSH